MMTSRTWQHVGAGGSFVQVAQTPSRLTARWPRGRLPAPAIQHQLVSKLGHGATADGTDNIQLLGRPLRPRLALAGQQVGVDLSGVHGVIRLLPKGEHLPDDDAEHPLQNRAIQYVPKIPSVRPMSEIKRTD